MGKGLNIAKFAVVPSMIVADVTILVHQLMLSYNKTVADNRLEMLNRISHLSIRTGAVFQIMNGMGFPMKKVPMIRILRIHPLLIAH